MKYKKCNLEKMPDAINEYENTKQTYKEICEKYDISINSFFYYLKKSRTTSIEMTRMGEIKIKKIKPQKGNSLQNFENSNIFSEIDSEGNKLVSFNTTSKKMKEYMKHHNIQVMNNTTGNNSETTSTGGDTVKQHIKKQPERVDLDKFFEGYI